MRVLYLALAFLSASALAQQSSPTAEPQFALTSTAGDWRAEL